jgi:3-dehydroquinate dehydratase-2
MPTAFFLNGPNANMYGLDAKGVYGTESFPAIRQRCLDAAARLGLALEFRQTNHEGEMVDWIQQARAVDGLLINGASLSYRSIAVLDALLMLECPVLEVHMSNIHRREPFRARTRLSLAATGSICGLGPLGYELAIGAMARLIATRRQR